jgi:dTDP-4-dehydrorhamnose reductase
MVANKVLLFGKFGQVGSQLLSKLKNYEVVAYDYPEIDFNQTGSIGKLIDQVQPGLIINAVAYTAVDQAETEKAKANNINGHVMGVIAEKAKQYQAGLIHYSTDYVFDGLKGSAYTEEDQPNPLNVYGESKLLGETRITQVGGSYLIFRLSWVYSTTNPSFVTKVLDWSRKHETLRIVDDQISNPTWATMVAEKTVEIVDNYSENWYQGYKPLSGIYHLVGKNPVSRYEWAKSILELYPNNTEQVTKEIIPAKSDEFPTPADRPKFSGLDCTKFEKTFNISLPDWKTSLEEAMKNLTEK